MSMPRVVAVVMEKRAIPKRESHIFSPPKSMNGRDNPVEISAVFFAPSISEIIPPRAFPRAIIKNKRIVCKTPLFQPIGMP